MQSSLIKIPQGNTFRGLSSIVVCWQFYYKTFKTANYPMEHRSVFLFLSFFLVFLLLYRTDTQKLERREQTLKEMLDFIPGSLVTCT